MARIYQLEAILASADKGQWIGQENLGFRVVELNSGYARGVQLVSLRCWDKTVEILPTRGLGVWRAYRNQIRFGWDSPIGGPVHPQWVNLADPSGLGWLDGFDELMVRCGLLNNGAPEFHSDGRLKWGLHGRVANLPATEVEIEIDEATQSITLRGVVVEQRFHFYRWAMQSRITLTRGSSEIEIRDRIENQSDRPGNFQLLYHCNFGPPVLESGSRFLAPVVKVYPRDERAAEGFAQWETYRDPDPKYREEVYFMELAADETGSSLAMITNRNQSLAAYVRYGVGQLPCFTLWKNTVGLRDGYVTGLEPGTNYPNPRSVEEQAGRVVELAGGQAIEFDCSMGLLVDAAEVAEVRERIERLGSLGAIAS